MDKIVLSPLEKEKQDKLKKNKPLAYEKFIKYPEKIARNESVAMVQVQYDFFCNFFCRHCGISVLRKNGDLRRFTVPDVENLGDQMNALGLASINISGGNPTSFPDLDKIVLSLKPDRFYLQCDSNGWDITRKKAKHLKGIGIDRMQVSIDSMDEKEHDDFRRRPGSWRMCIDAIEAMKAADLEVQCATVVTSQRLRSMEFIRFLEFMAGICVPVSVVWPKPIGKWEGNFSGLIGAEDKKYFRELEKQYNVYDHTSKKFGTDRGCCSFKYLINITQYGDVFGCCYLPISIGSIFNEPLKDILERGMRYKKFMNSDKCLMSENMDFINKYVVKTYGKELPVPIEEIMDKL